MQAHGRGPQGASSRRYHCDVLGRRSRKAVRKGKPNRRPFPVAGLPVAAGAARQRQPPQLELRSGQPVEPLAALEQAGDSRRQIFTGITPI
ncbi:hypothetical protein M8494_11610 [Serratia ureilytica]